MYPGYPESTGNPYAAYRPYERVETASAATVWLEGLPPRSPCAATATPSPYWQILPCLPPLSHTHQQAARGAGDGADGGKHRLRRRRRKHFAADRRREHAAADIAGVCGFVTRPSPCR